jgi:hypothetical protein
VAEILGMKFSGIIAWWLWRGIYLEQTAWLPKESARRARLEMLDMVFSKDIVQLPTFALAHDFASGGSVQTREHITNNSPTVEQEEDEV